MSYVQFPFHPEPRISTSRAFDERSPTVAVVLAKFRGVFGRISDVIGGVRCPLFDTLTPESENTANSRHGNVTADIRRARESWEPGPA